MNILIKCAFSQQAKSLGCLCSLSFGCRFEFGGDGGVLSCIGNRRLLWDFLSFSTHRFSGWS